MEGNEQTVEKLENKPKKKLSNMATRIITGVVGTALLAALIYFHGYVIAIALVLVSVIVQYEMIKTFKTAGIKPVSPVLYAFTLLVYPVYTFLGGLDAVFMLQMIMVTLIFVAGVVFKGYNYESIFSSVFSLYYPQLFFVFFYMIIGIEDVELSRLIIIVAFACSCCTDIAAYFVGSFMGKQKLCPRISPKKTVEGAIGGLLGGVVGVLVAAIFFDNGRVHLIEYAMFALVISAMSQIGDLTASVVKRRYNVKDFGSILPGHGGLLDRLDSTLFILPLVYMFYKIYLGF